MDACVRLLRTRFEQIVELFLAPEQLLNRKHDLFSRTRPRSLLQRQNCVRAVPHQRTHPELSATLSGVGCESVLGAFYLERGGERRLVRGATKSHARAMAADTSLA